MKKYILFIVLAFGSAKLSAQKIDSLFFNLYTDSLKKGSWNYINVDAKLNNGKFMPLTSEQLKFKVSNGKLEGNSVWIDWDFKQDSIVVEAMLKKDPAVKRVITIWIKKVDHQLNAPVNDSLLKQINNRQKSTKRKRKN
ncbi:MAG: hypothetical protein K2Q24_11875 [Chitinophagaceae bacterium]|nr:hypothetical protein [Chitinophagaceae bacterium]